MQISRVILRIQGCYYIMTGLWPLLSINTFEQVTGPKTDRWLVYMVGLLAAGIGISIIAGARYSQIRNDTVILSVLAATAFSAVDITFVLNGTIAPIYLTDAGLHVLLMGCLFAFLRSERSLRRIDSVKA